MIKVPRLFRWRVWGWRGFAVVGGVKLRNRFWWLQAACGLPIGSLNELVGAPTTGTIGGLASEVPVH